MRNLAAVYIAIAVGPCALNAQGLEWSGDIAQALQRGASEKKVVMLALNMKGERSSDWLTHEHYRDPRLAQLGRQLIPVFVSVGSDRSGKKSTGRESLHTALHHANEDLVRERFIKTKPGNFLLAPQHLFIGPDGKLLTASAGPITAGELEWMMCDAMRRIEQQPKWELSEAARAPRDFRTKRANNSDGGKLLPPSRQEVAQALKDIRKARRSRRARKKSAELARVLVRSDHPEALIWGKRSLKIERGNRAKLLQSIGELAPKSWWVIVAPYLEDRTARNRKAAVIALHKIAEIKSLAKLRRALRKEQDVEVLGRLLRALAWIQPTDRSTATAIRKALKHTSERVRSHATIAAGLLEKREAVTASLRIALQDDSTLVRSAAAYVIGTRQDRSMLKLLGEITAVESHAATKSWMQKAQTAVREGNVRPLERFLRQSVDGNRAKKASPKRPRDKRQGE